MSIIFFNINIVYYVLIRRKLFIGKFNYILCAYCIVFVIINSSIIICASELENVGA